MASRVYGDDKGPMIMRVHDGMMKFQVHTNAKLYWVCHKYICSCKQTSSVRWKYIAERIILCPADVDECAEQLDDCDTNADCTDTVGSFTCDCVDGFIGNGFTCAGMSSSLKLCMTICAHIFVRVGVAENCVGRSLVSNTMC